MEKTSDQPTGKLPDSKALQQRITPKQLRQKSTNEPWIMTCPKPLIYISTPLPSTKPPTSFIPTEATCSSALCFTIAFWKNWRSSMELYSFSFSKVAAYDSQYRKDIWRSNPNGCHLLLKAAHRDNHTHSAAVKLAETNLFSRTRRISAVCFKQALRTIHTKICHET